MYTLYVFIVILLLLLVVSAIWEDDLKTYYGADVFRFSYDYANKDDIASDLSSRKERLEYIHSVKTAAFYDSIQHLNEIITDMLRKEVILTLILILPISFSHLRNKSYCLIGQVV